jgi:hypothetical protein
MARASRPARQLNEEILPGRARRAMFDTAQVHARLDRLLQHEPGGVGLRGQAKLTRENA